MNKLLRFGFIFCIALFLLDAVAGGVFGIAHGRYALWPSVFFATGEVLIGFWSRLFIGRLARRVLGGLSGVVVWVFGVYWQACPGSLLGAFMFGVTLCLLLHFEGSARESR